jgi:peroxiredoxin Q/BCP
MEGYPVIPKVGQKAPNFKLPAYPEGTVSLKDFQGAQATNVVLYFYPTDDTPTCTKEACEFRDNFARLTKGDTVVLGISPDSVKSHKKFAEKYELPFTLLADEDHAVCEKYGVWTEKSLFGRTYMGVQRATFLIDKQGKIAAVWPKVLVKGHTDKVAAAIAELG